MTALSEFYESGNAPHEALGRAARRLASGGALYLGGGVGIERRREGDADSYAISHAAPGSKEEVFRGPLSAVMRAFALAGGSSAPDTPGGAAQVTDPAVAARLRELSDEEAECKRDIARYTARAARRRAQASKAGVATTLPWSPVAREDDQWELRMVEEKKADLSRIQAERKRLLATGKVEEAAEAGKPGTNWSQVTPANRKKIGPIVSHYMKSAHPFIECVRDNRKRFGDRAEQVCAVVKDMGKRSTKWRKGGSSKVSEEVERLLVAAEDRLSVIDEAFGVGMAIELAQLPSSAVKLGAPGTLGEELATLGELAAADLGLLALAGHPLAVMVFEGFDEGLHPRDPHGKFREKMGALKKQGDHFSMFGVSISHSGGRGYAVNNLRGDLGTMRTAFTPNPKSAVEMAVGRSLASKDPNSLGGAKSYSSVADLPGNEGMSKPVKLPGSGERHRQAMATRGVGSDGDIARRAAASRDADARAGKLAPETQKGIAGQVDSAMNQGMSKSKALAQIASLRGLTVAQVRALHAEHGRK